MKLIECGSGMFVPVTRCWFQIQEVDPSEQRVETWFKNTPGLDEKIKELWPNVWLLRVGTAFLAANTTDNFSRVVDFFKTRLEAEDAMRSLVND